MSNQIDRLEEYANKYIRPHVKIDIIYSVFAPNIITGWIHIASENFNIEEFFDGLEDGLAALERIRFNVLTNPTFEDIVEYCLKFIQPHVDRYWTRGRDNGEIEVIAGKLYIVWEFSTLQDCLNKLKHIKQLVFVERHNG